MQKIFIYILLLFSGEFVSAQSGALDLRFEPGAGTNDAIRAVAIQNDGKILIGGLFTSYNGIPAYSIARLNTDGSLDTSFNTGIGSAEPVYAIAVQDDGKILAGGGFLDFNGVPADKIVRLHSDGSVDTSFSSIVFGGAARALLLQDDGKIIMAGSFTNAENIIRLETNGAIDNSFNTNGGANGSVECLMLQPDGKILIGGSFTAFAGYPIVGRVTRLHSNGSLDNSFNGGIGGATNNVRAIDIKDNGKIFLAGNFEGYNGTQVNYFFRTLQNGSVDFGFENGTSANNAVYAVKELNNEAILIAGDFTAYDGDTANRIARLLEDGYIDTSFNTGTGANALVHVLAIQQDEKIILAGDFTSFNGVTRNRIARLYNCLTPQPNTIAGNDSVLCSQTLVYSVPPVADAESYEWTLPAGWAFNSDSTAHSITVVSNGEGGVISVRAFSDSCGYSNPQTKTVYKIPPPEIPLCLVTVDTASTHNILLWEKPADKSLIDSFFIYRETSTNVYTKIGAVHRDSLSAFHDYAADPNVTSYRYKISILDICRVESEKSDFHNTIHLQNLGNGNFQWTFYQIEATPNPVINFKVYRDNFGNGNFTQIGFVPGTNSTFTDNNYTLFDSSIYVVDVDWARSCTPQRGPVNTTRSNIRRVNRIDTLWEPPDTTSVSIQPVLQESFLVYPNPAAETLTLQFVAPAVVSSIQLVNALGQIAWSEEHPEFNIGNEKMITVKSFPQGIYFLLVETNAGAWRRKIMLQ